jgi:predicted restriction endonuclease
MDWLGRAAKLRQWSRNGTRAPHKPLLLLYALGRFQEDVESDLRYSAVEQDLQRLLTEYGPPNRTTPAYPFHHLVSDGAWMRDSFSRALDDDPDGYDHRHHCHHHHGHDRDDDRDDDHRHHGHRDRRDRRDSDGSRERERGRDDRPYERGRREADDHRGLKDQLAQLANRLDRISGGDR